MTTWGFIGSGHIGSHRRPVGDRAGHDVVMSNSRGRRPWPTWSPSSAPTPVPPTPGPPQRAGDVAVVTIPLRAYRDVPVAELDGKLVLDTMNYYPQRDGEIAELEDESTTTSELLQAHLPSSRRGQGVQQHRLRPPRRAGPPVRQPGPQRPARSRGRRRGEDHRRPRCSTRSATTRSTSARSPRAGASSATPPPTARSTPPTRPTGSPLPAAPGHPRGARRGAGRGSAATATWPEPPRAVRRLGLAWARRCARPGESDMRYGIEVVPFGPYAEPGPGWSWPRLRRTPAGRRSPCGTTRTSGRGRRPVGDARCGRGSHLSTPSGHPGEPGAPLPPAPARRRAARARRAQRWAGGLRGRPRRAGGLDPLGDGHSPATRAAMTDEALPLIARGARAPPSTTRGRTTVRPGCRCARRRQAGDHRSGSAA